jgi:hypothetical protein
VQLSPDGSAARGDPSRLFKTINRYRDVMVSPDGRTIYVAADSGGPTKGSNGAMSFELQNPGTILAFNVRR